MRFSIQNECVVYNDSRKQKSFRDPHNSDSCIIHYSQIRHSILIDEDYREASYTNTCIINSVPVDHERQFFHGKRWRFPAGALCLTLISMLHAHTQALLMKIRVSRAYRGDCSSSRTKSFVCANFLFVGAPTCTQRADESD